MLRTVTNYSPTPKPRRGNRRVSGGGPVSGAEPLLVGVTDPLVRVVPSAQVQTPSALKGKGASTASRADPLAQPLAVEERERLEWMRQQRPPHWGNNIV